MSASPTQVVEPTLLIPWLRRGALLSNSGARRKIEAGNVPCAILRTFLHRIVSSHQQA